MFGYVVPDKMNMYMKDYYRYRAFYCGLCKSIGNKCGQCMRFTTNYDVTFLSLLAHGVLGIEPEFNNEGCILNPIKKKTIAKDNELMQQIVDINTLLTYYKLIDDKVDGRSLSKEIARSMLVEGKYKKARQKFPQLDEFFAKSYEKLRQLERENCNSIDRLADPFASMLAETIVVLCGDKCTTALKELMYNIGRWVYFMDAVDDVDEDYKKKQFNPFLVGYNYKDRATFNTERSEDIQFALMHAYNSACKRFEEIEVTVNEGVLTNIVWYGLLDRTNDITRRTTKCKKIRI